MQWLSQFFLNPGFVLPGAALASVPIVIHLLSRLRYKKVRFAAMEFLLQSDEQNRRRLIIEQLLLLLLRVLAVILIGLLIARLILDPSSMLLMRGATTHHVIVIDDTLSMRAISSEQPLFDAAVDTVQRMTSQAGGRPGAQRVTVITMSEPDRPLVMDRALDATLMQDLGPRLSNLKCSWQSVSPVTALQAAANVINGGAGVAPQVHVVTDLRKSDWQDRPDVTEALESLAELEAEVSLIQVAEESLGNVSLSELSADNLAVAVGIPWRMKLSFTNDGSQIVTGLRAVVMIDGNTLPVKVLIPDIEAGESAELAHDITFDAPGLHAVQVRLEDDLLNEDNSRFLAVEVTTSRRVLVIDSEASQDDAQFLSLAISDPDLTGRAAEVRTADVLTAASLSDYDCIYLLNVPELPADAVERLRQYVESGGGLAWFPDERANTGWYNALAEKNVPLFPVKLTSVHKQETADEADSAERPYPAFEQHPIFLTYNDPEARLADALRFRQWYSATTLDDDRARVLCRMSSGDPIIFEHTVGRGRVMTFLTTAGRRWSNWPIADAPGYVVTQMLLAEYLQKPSGSVADQEIDNGLTFSWPISQYSETLDIYLPESPDEDAEEDTFLRLQAAPEQTDPAVLPDQPGGAEGPTADSEERLTVPVPQARRPGVYRIKQYQLDGEPSERLLALNVPATESDLTAADPQQVVAQSESGHVRVVPASTSDELSETDAGRELRWLLIGLLTLVLLCEQLLALRLSFHPEAAA
ncbi:MAG: BatA domain-containing protein [Planctomycetaceae bacterium]|nr:BatA domain-containing protein [Planctomycetaceae bacterium]